MGYRDSKGYWREDGEGGYDSEGYYREAGEGGYDSKGYYREAGEGGYDSEGYYREAGEGGYDSSGYYREGAYSAASSASKKQSSYDQSDTVTYGGSSEDHTAGGGYTGSSRGIGGRIIDLILTPFNFIANGFQFLCIVFIVGSILVAVLFIAGVRSGLIKSSVSISFENIDVRMQDTSTFQLVAVSTSGKHKTYTAKYDEDIQGFKIKLKKGTYDLYFEYDGGVTSISEQVIDGYSDYDGTYDALLEVLFTRLVSIRLYNADDETITADSITITDQNGEKTVYNASSDWVYYIFVDNNEEDLTWTISAEGYEDYVISFDPTEYRSCEMTVFLDEG